MKKAYLIYEDKEAQKNHGFIEMFQQAGKEKGIDFSFVSKKDYQKFSEMTNPDLVLNRTRDPGVSRWYEKRNIPVYHNSRLVEIANHKYKMMAYFQEHLPEEILKEKWCPATVFLTDPAQMGNISNSNIEKAEIMKCFPDHIGAVTPEALRHGVIKSVSGHGGSEVFLVEDQEKWRDILAGREGICGSMYCPERFTVPCFGKEKRISGQTSLWEEVSVKWDSPRHRGSILAVLSSVFRIILRGCIVLISCRYPMAGCSLTRWRKWWAAACFISIRSMIL